MYKLERKGYGEFASGTMKDMFKKARKNAREVRRAYTGTGWHKFERFLIRDEQGNAVAAVVCRPTQFEKEDVCKRREGDGKAYYKYYYEVRGEKQ